MGAQRELTGRRYVTEPTLLCQIVVNTLEIEEIVFPFRPIEAIRMGCLWMGGQGRLTIQGSAGVVRVQNATRWSSVGWSLAGSSKC